MLRFCSVFLAIIFIVISSGCQPRIQAPGDAAPRPPVSGNTVGKSDAGDMKTFPRGSEISGFDDIEKACQLSADHKYTDSIKLFDEMLPKYAGKPVATAYLLAQRGGAYDHAKEPEKAEKDFRDALKQDVSDDIKAIILFQLARNMDQAKNEYGGRQREEEIYDVLRQIEKLQPDFEINSRVGQKAGMTAIRMLVEIEILKGEYAQAAELITKGLTKRPDDRELLDDRAKCYYLLNNMEKAKQDAEKRISLPVNKRKNEPEEISPFVYLILGKNKEALETINQKLNEEPNNPWLYIDSARINIAMKNETKAKENLKKASTLCNSDKNIRKQITEINKMMEK
ncbi:MAG: hypothetical protein LWY06_12365 [Firmicutes bacterium]|nr:hypothetical protein [Bacillota bacterium]